VVVSLQLHAVGDSRLFKQVRLNIGTGDTKDIGEVNTNEFTLQADKDVGSVLLMHFI
jgi:hypothetical protein